jgi:hypothetical protein
MCVCVCVCVLVYICVCVCVFVFTRLRAGWKFVCMCVCLCVWLRDSLPACVYFWLERLGVTHYELSSDQRSATGQCFQKTAGV